jgi:hypothetical protein
LVAWVPPCDLRANPPVADAPPLTAPLATGAAVTEGEASARTAPAAHRVTPGLTGPGSHARRVPTSGPTVPAGRRDQQATPRAHSRRAAIAPPAAAASRRGQRRPASSARHRRYARPRSPRSASPRHWPAPALVPAAISSG